MRLTKEENRILKNLDTFKTTISELDVMVASKQVTEEQAVCEASRIVGQLGLSFGAIVLLSQDKNYSMPGYWISRRIRNNWR
jgi:hypothetical protein